MLESKDSTMKLFGKTIPAPEISAGAPALSSGDADAVGVVQNHGSSSVNGDGEEHEIQQVWKIIDFESGPILEMRKDLVGRC